VDTHHPQPPRPDSRTVQTKKGSKDQDRHLSVPLHLSLRAPRLPVWRKCTHRPLLRASAWLERGTPAGAGAGIRDRSLFLCGTPETHPPRAARRSAAGRVMVDEGGGRALASAVRRYDPVGAVSSRGRAARSGADRAGGLGRDLARAAHLGELALDTPRSSTSRSPARPTRRTTAPGTSGKGGSGTPSRRSSRMQPLSPGRSTPPKPCSTRARCLPASPTWTSTPYAPPSPRRPRTPTTPPSSGASAPYRPRPSLRLMAKTPSQTSHRLPTQPPELYPFVGGVREGMPEGLPFHLADYLDLVNFGPVGRCAPTNAGPSPRICRRS